MARMMLSILFVLFILIGPTAAYAVPFVTINGLSPAGGAADIGGTYGNFTIAAGGTVTAVPSDTSTNPLNDLRLSNTTITLSPTAIGPATLTINYRDTFPLTQAQINAQRFYGTSMSGNFSFRGDIFTPATGDSITMSAFVDYTGLIETFGSATVDLNKNFTVISDNFFAPQNPAQGTATFLCSSVLDTTCNPQETLRAQVSIALAPGDMISLVGTLDFIGADSATLRDQKLADLARVPAPPTLLLFFSSVLAAPAVRWIRRKGLFRKGSLDTNG